MPDLTWPGKRLDEPIPATIVDDSIVYPGGIGYPNVFPDNRLILGDNLAIMSSLLADYEGKINLIYADPPFFTNRKFSARIGRGEDSRKPDEWRLADGYHDHWTGIDSYLDFLYQRLAIMYRLLAPNGTLYLHLDWHADAYARLLLDELFGTDHILNEVIWTYHGPSPIRSAFNRKHDTILVYVKGKNYTFNVDAIREPYNPNTVSTFRSSSRAGFGKMPDLERGKVPEDWWYFPVVARLHSERTGYPTQKPEALLERIILASSNPGDLVADFFCGSGTTSTVSAMHGRKFIACDETPRAIHTTRNRLIASRTPFVIQYDVNSDSSFLPMPKTTEIRVDNQKISLKTRLDVDYWEVDPIWDGKLFRSAAQAVRPVRNGEIQKAINVKAGRNVCIRLTTTTGKRYQLNI